MYKINTVIPAIIKVDMKEVVMAKESRMTDINKYIDRCLIDEYATKSKTDGYSLDTDDLPKAEINTFLSILMENDSDVRDYVLHSMQNLIDKRLPIVEGEDAFWRRSA